MCLVSVCPKGTIKNSKEVYDFIKNGAACNRDGSGIMYKINGENIINIDKGYFKIEDLISKLETLNLGIEDELVIHHRIGTSGHISTTNTHPYLISKVEEETLRTDISINKPALAHNGMFYGIRKYMQYNTDLSDTYAFARYIMPDTIDLLDTNEELFKLLLDKVIGTDKVCILYPDKDLKMLGYFIENNGYYHSNSGYCRTVYNRGGDESEIDYTNFTAVGDSGFNLPAVITNNKIKSILGNKNPVALSILLDSSMIKINESNYDHFYLVDKNYYNKLPINDKAKGYWELEGFDSSADCQVIKKPSDTINDRMMALRSDYISRDYYYIPKTKDLIDTYSDYFKLVTSFPEYTKSGYKKLSNLINNAYKKKNSDLIKYDKLNKMVTKMSLQLYKTYLDNTINSKSLILTT